VVYEEAFLVNSHLSHNFKKNDTMEKIQTSLLKEIEKITHPLALQIVELVVKETKSGINIRLVVAKKSGVSIDDCERVTKLLNERIEILSLLDSDNYTLQVSSPGLYRVFKNKSEYTIFTSRNVKIILRDPIDTEHQQKVYEGKLISLKDDIVSVQINGTLLKIPYNKIQKTKLNG